jgi:hypothetical protein
MLTFLVCEVWKSYVLGGIYHRTEVSLDRIRDVDVIADFTPIEPWVLVIHEPYTYKQASTYWNQE